MPVFRGRLSILDPNSFLMPGNEWLLLSSVPNPQQAGIAATRFIQDVKQIQTGTLVTVTGISGSIGAQPVIRMSDIAAAGALAESVVAGEALPVAPVPDSAPARKGTAKRKPKQPGKQARPPKKGTGKGRK